MWTMIILVSTSLLAVPGFSTHGDCIRARTTLYNAFAKQTGKNGGGMEIVCVPLSEAAHVGRLAP